MAVLLLPVYPKPDIAFSYPMDLAYSETTVVQTPVPLGDMSLRYDDHGFCSLF